ncbi:MAG: hypothetical protein QM757_40605 [Paludibaculum sp.]
MMAAGKSQALVLAAADESKIRQSHRRQYRDICVVPYVVTAVKSAEFQAESGRQMKLDGGTDRPVFGADLEMAKVVRRLPEGNASFDSKGCDLAPGGRKQEKQA